MKIILRILLSITFAIIANITYSQRSNFYNYTISDGLPNSQINCFYQDNTGYIWVGTAEGARKFDGLTFNEIKPFNIIGNEINRGIKGFAETDSNIFFCTEKSIFKCEGNTAIEYKIFTPQNNILIANIILANKRILVLTSKGLYEFKNNTFNNLLLPLTNNAITSGVIINKGCAIVLGFATTGGVQVFDTDKFKNISQKFIGINRLPAGKIKNIAYDNKTEKIYFSILGSGVFEYNGAFTQKILFASNEDFFTSCLAIDKKSNLWLSTFGNGTIKYSKNGVSYFKKINGVCEDNLNTVFVDKDDNIWIGSLSAGISLYNKNSYVMFNTSHGLPGNEVHDLKLHPYKGLVVATLNGLAIYDQFSLNKFGPNMRVGNIDINEQGIICGGTYNGELFTIDKNSDKIKKYNNSGTSEILTLKYLDLNLVIYGKYKSGIHLFDLNKNKEIDIENNFKEKTVHSILLDKYTGIIWIGTERGIYRIIDYKKSLKCESYLENNEEVSTSITYSLACDEKYFYIGSDCCGLGIINKKTENLTFFGKINGLSSNVIKGILPVTPSNIYISTTNAINNLTFINHKPRVTQLNDNKQELSSDYNPNAIIMDDYGVIWLGTNTGLVSYNNDFDNKNKKKKYQVVISDILLFNKPTDWKARNQIINSKKGYPDQLNLKYSEDNFTIFFSALNFDNNRDLTYEYKLEGYNESWLSINKLNRAVFSNIPYGQYIFKVRAKLNNTEVISNEEKLSVTIEKPFWAKSWFIFSVVALIAIIIILLFRAYQTFDEQLISYDNNQFEEKSYRLIIYFGGIATFISSCVYMVISNEFFYSHFLFSFFFIVCIIIALASYSSEFLIQNFAKVLKFLLYQLMISILIVTYLEKINYYYALITVLIVTVSPIVIKSPKEYFLFALFVEVLAVTNFFLATPDSSVPPIGYLFCITLAIITTYLILLVQLNANDKLMFIDNAINSGNSLVISSNKKGEIVYASKTFKKILGYDEKQILGDGWWKLRQNWSLPRENFLDDLNNNSLQTLNLSQVRNVQNQIRLIQWENSTLDSGLIVGVGMDVTEQKAIEERYKLLVENASDIIYTTNFNGEFTFANEVATRITGYQLNELIGRRYITLISEDYVENVVAFYYKQIKQRDPISYHEFPLIKKDGSIAWIGQTVRLTVNQENPKFYDGFQAVCRDITSRIVAEKKLYAYNQRLKLISEIKQEILLSDTLYQMSDIVLKELIKHYNTSERISITEFDLASNIGTVNYGNKEEAFETKTLVKDISNIGSLDSLKQNKNYAFADLTKKLNLNDDDKFWIEKGIRSVMVIPIFFNETLYGSVNLLHKYIGVYTKEDEQFLNEVAESLAINMARLGFIEIIIEKNKDINDNIDYASRIQNAVIPSEQYLQSHFKNAFVLLLQRDKVGGDFYYMLKKETQTFLAVGDCTGHGVSGALLTILSTNYLREAVNTLHLTDPALVLEHLNKSIAQTLNLSGAMQNEIRDGLDIAMCILDKTTKAIYFAGAMNSIYTVTNGVLTEHKATRIPIGGTLFDMTTNYFCTQIIPIEKDTTLYLTSDGFTDQFSPLTNTKFGKSKFKQMLQSIQAVPVAQQKNYLLDAHLEWKRNNSQTDDVCVVALALNDFL